MWLLLLIAIIGLKTLLCKGLAMGIFLLALWRKGRQLSFASDAWDRFFLSLPAARVQRYAIGIYLAAAVISSVISYCILKLAGIQTQFRDSCIDFHRWAGNYGLSMAQKRKRISAEKVSGDP